MGRRDDDGALFDLTGGPRRGRAERAVDDAVRAARKRDQLDDVDAATIAAARVAARAVDVAERGIAAGAVKLLYALPGLLREHRETLTALGLTRKGSPGADVELDAFLAGLGTATVSD